MVLELRKTMTLALAIAAGAVFWSTGVAALSYNDVDGKWCTEARRTEFTPEHLIVFRYSDNARFNFPITRYEFSDREVRVFWVREDGRSTVVRPPARLPVTAWAIDRGPRNAGRRGRVVYRRPSVRRSVPIFTRLSPGRDSFCRSVWGMMRTAGGLGRVVMPRFGSDILRHTGASPHLGKQVNRCSRQSF